MVTTRQLQPPSGCFLAGGGGTISNLSHAPREGAGAPKSFFRLSHARMQAMGVEGGEFSASDC